jgi:hypothetical protein
MKYDRRKFARVFNMPDGGQLLCTAVIDFPDPDKTDKLISEIKDKPLSCLRMETMTKKGYASVEMWVNTRKAKDYDLDEMTQVSLDELHTMSRTKAESIYNRMIEQNSGGDVAGYALADKSGNITEAGSLYEDGDEKEYASAAALVKELASETRMARYNRGEDPDVDPVQGPGKNDNVH